MNRPDTTVDEVARSVIGDATITISHYPHMNDAENDDPPYGCYFCNVRRANGDFELGAGGSWCKALGEFAIANARAIARLNDQLVDKHLIRGDGK